MDLYQTVVRSSPILNKTTFRVLLTLDECERLEKMVLLKITVGGELYGRTLAKIYLHCVIT